MRLQPLHRLGLGALASVLIALVCVTAPVRAFEEATKPTSDTAKAPAGESVQRAASKFAHGNWPFRPLVKPAVPAVKDQAFVKNPVDAFVLAELEEAGIGPGPSADRLTLLRRVTFDLTGLPPSLAEQEAFLKDPSDDAFEKVVDRLLESPHYGERFAQHWLDLVRFAESDGFNQDAIREQAYRYRDYVIQAFNDDLPYDKFIAQQLAGDELEPHNPQAIVATGYNRLYPDEWNAGDLRLRRQEILDDVTDTTGLVFLGLTMGCAQCHDHKFDEILQADYFRLQAFFAPMLARDDIELATPDERRRREAQQAKYDAATQEIRDEIEKLLEPKRTAALKGVIKKYDAEIQTAILTPDAERTGYQKALNRQAWLYYSPKLATIESSLKGKDKERFDELQAKLKKFEHLKPAPLPRAMAISDASSVAPVTYRLATGNVRKPLEKVEPGFPQFLGASEPQISSPAGRDTTGRRSALATWLTRADHPLTTRVMVNRVWQYHFGEGIVSSANDFGAMGASPTHPDLLDWLAVTFVEQGWSFKKLHRVMVTSNAYQRSAECGVPSAELAAAEAVTKHETPNTKHNSTNPQSTIRNPQSDADPDNRLLWHARRRRLEGEAIRDAMLAVSGELNRKLFGPSAKPEVPAGASNLAWKADPPGDNQFRRSLYVLMKRNFRYPMFDAFDSPDMHHSCAKRPSTTTAPQALVQLNSPFSFERARHWAANLLATHGDDTARLIATAYREALGRQAEPAEIAAAREFVAQVEQSLVDKSLEKDIALPTKLPSGVQPARGAAVVEFCHALFNCNEFLYVD